MKDCEKNKLRMIFDNDVDYNLVLSIFKSQYNIVREIFRFYSSKNFENAFALNRKCFINACKELGFFDDKNCNIVY